MKCYAFRVSTKLLSIPTTSQVAVTTDGTAYRVLPDTADDQSDVAQDYKLATNLNVSGGTSPTAQIVLQTSVDGSSWIDIASGTQRTAAGAYREVVDTNGAVLLPWVRARVVLGGTANPSVDASVELVSTGGFRLSTT